VLHATAKLKNAGGKTAVGAQVRFYLSTDAILDGGDTALGSSVPVDLASSEERLVSASSVLSAQTAPGDYYLLARADPDEAISESDEGNNTAPPAPIKVGVPTPDLVMFGVSSPTEATPGQSLEISRIIANIGNADVTTASKYTY